MRKILLAAAAVLGLGIAATDASACCHKKACPPAPVPCVAPIPAPCPPPAPVCAPVAKKHCFKMPTFSMPKFGCHKKVACAPAPAPCAAPVVYAAPAPSAQGWAAPAPQALPAGQGY